MINHYEALVFFHGFLQETHRKPRSGAGRASHACASASLVLGQAKEATWRGDVAGVGNPRNKNLEMIRFSIATFDHINPQKHWVYNIISIYNR